MIPIVKIGVIDYAVSTVTDLKRKEDGAMLYGYINHLDQKIDVEEKMSITMQQIALIHEVLHGIVHQSGVISDDEEQFVIAISHGIYALLKQNPDLVRYLVGNTL